MTATPSRPRSLEPTDQSGDIGGGTAGERRFRALAEATGEVVWVTDANGEVTGPLPSLERFCGCPTSDLLGTGWQTLVHPDDRAGLLTPWNAARLEGTSFRARYRMRRADGSWRLMLARGVPVRDDEGVVCEWVGVNLDVTDQYETERELRASESRLARAQEIGGIGTWEMDGRTYHTILSANVWRMHGLDGDIPTFTHDNWLESLPAAEREAAASKIEASLRDGVPYHHVTHFTRPDGSVFIAEARAERVIDDDGTARLLGTIQDVTERVAREKALQESEERLAQRALDRTQ